MIRQDRRYAISYFSQRGIPGLFCSCLGSGTDYLYTSFDKLSKSTYDFIIVGGEWKLSYGRIAGLNTIFKGYSRGAGNALANRLTENPRFPPLVLKAGGW